MSVDRIHNEVVFICDDCDETLETGEADFGEAVREKRRAGWGSYKQGSVWKDHCPNCGQADFEDLGEDE